MINIEQIYKYSRSLKIIAVISTVTSYLTLGVHRLYINVDNWILNRFKYLLTTNVSLYKQHTYINNSEYTYNSVIS